MDIWRSRMFASTIIEGKRQLITKSQVLPGLTMSPLEEAMRHSRQVDQTVGAWLLQQMQAP